jgi:YfiH family protein
VSLTATDVLRPDWPAPPRVRAMITTRSGGASRSPYGGPTGSGGMNLGYGSGDDMAVVAGNRARLRAQLPAEPGWLKQVHGARVVDAAMAAGASPQAEADASITDRPGVVAVAMVADCMPVFLADPQGRCVGVAHAGWRGLAAGVIEATVQAMRQRLGDPTARLLAYLGPAIGPDHFEVGTEVLRAMSDRFEGAATAFVDLGGGKHRADLFALGKMALATVDVDAVFGGGHCTFCDAERFYSHRRDRVTGRHAALIWLADDPVV